MAPSPPPAPGSAAPAPWRALFLEHLGTLKQATFVLSTLHPAPPSPSSPSSPSSSPPPPPPPAALPRARTCVFRGLWAELPADDRNAAPRNPRVYASDLPAFTTDARMQKVPEVGAGGPVEAVFWVPGAQTQWRVRGPAWVLGPDADGEAAEPARRALLARMRSAPSPAGEEQEEEGGGGGGGGGGGAAGAAGEEWSWAREVTAHFGNLSPGMRGTFRNPPPGAPRAGTRPGEGEGLGQKVDDLEDAVARRHFRVVVVAPQEVDQVDLSDPDDVRRWLYTYAEARGGWDKVELWP